MQQPPTELFNHSFPAKITFPKQKERNFNLNLSLFVVNLPGLLKKKIILLYSLLFQIGSAFQRLVVGGESGQVGGQKSTISSQQC